MIFNLFCSFGFAQGDFDPERAFAILNELVRDGERYYDAPKRQVQIQSLANRFSKKGFQTSLQRFTETESQTQKSFVLHNIVAKDPRPLKKRYVLGTHWDTRLWAEEDADPKRRNQPITGANDGSSGIALLLEVAYALRKSPTKNFAVDIILFDGEEFGRPGKGGYCKGSEFFVRNIEEHYVTPPSKVLIFDMIADADLQLERELLSMRSSPKLWRSVEKHFSTEGIPFSKQNRSIRDDQHPFQMAGIPSILLIDLSYPHWHTHNDTIDKCSLESLSKVGNALLGWLRKEDNAY